MANKKTQRPGFAQGQRETLWRRQGTGERYSYTLYDHLSRITEVGQINNASPAMTNNTSRNPTQLQNWMNSNITRRQQVTLTVYDQSAKESFLHKDLSPYIIQQRSNLRNRPSFTLFSKTGDVNNYDYAAFYNYDIHGNVDTLLQDYGATGLLAQNGGRYKRLTYQYDLISGKVNSVSYQPRLYDPVTKKYITQPDAFYHKYSYDAENRLTDVYTSTDEVYWEHDAYYEYYKHGPLARTMLGNQHVQGLDYAYTLQGWLKGVNSTAVGTGQYDAGNDGLAGSANHQVARDAFGFSLQYYGSDYTPIKNTNSFAAITGGFAGNAKPLYNGNISSMAVNIPRLGDASVYAYTYDQLNRITAMDAYSGLNGSNTFTPVLLDDYKERISYDPNGNILTYTRNGNKAGAQKSMDNLSYNYKNNTNQLVRVRHAIAATNYTEDIDDQPANNYTYDAIGNLIQDTKEGITKITWTVYGKIESITKTDGTAIDYSYDATGNRISKKVNEKETWYVRDAQGNVMSVYNKDASLNSGHFTQSELHLYGSSRLGIYNIDKDLTLTPPAATNLGSGNSGGFGIFERNKKFFELSNHLGNVLATVSDEKIGVDLNSDGQIDYYTASVVSANEYYPFGMGMPGRKFSTEKYRYGFNGKENDKDITEGAQDYGMRISDSRLGRFLSVDPLTKQYPWYTPYQFAGNKPIWATDLDGLEENLSTNFFSLNPGSGAITLQDHKTVYNFLQNKYANPSVSVSHHLIESPSTFISVSRKAMYSNTEAFFHAFGSQGEISMDQNPILYVTKITINTSSRIVDLDSKGKHLETKTNVVTIKVDISKGALDKEISEIEVNNSTTVGYSKILSQTYDGTLKVSLNKKDNFFLQPVLSTTKLPLGKTYDENLEMLPNDLAKKVDASATENVNISERAMKGIDKSFKKGEKAADDGKFIPKKGKYYDSQTKPKY